MKKNVAKNIFVWSMIILLAFSSGIFLAQMYLELQDTKSASAEVDNSMPSIVSLKLGDMLAPSSSSTDYFVHYSVFFHKYYNNNITFNISSVNRVFSNPNLAQYYLGNVIPSNSGVRPDDWNNVGFYFNYGLDTVVSSALNVIQTGDVLAYTASTSSTSFTGYNASTISAVQGGKYYLVSSASSSFSRFVGYTSGIVGKLNNTLYDFNTSFTNFSQYQDFILDTFSNGTYYIVSLFDNAYNRLTLFVRVSSQIYSTISPYILKEVFFYGDINSDTNAIYDNGYNSGYEIGYQAGHSQGVLDSNEYSFLGLLGAVVDAPIAAFTGLFNFELLGINLKDFLAGLFTICIIIVVVRLILVK